MPHDAAEMELPFCLGPAALWEALDADPLTSVIVASLAGRITHANAQAARFLVAANADPSTLVNRTLSDAFHPAAGQLYAQLFIRARQAGMPLLLREIWQGRQVVTRIQHVPLENCAEAEFAEGVMLMVGRRVEGALDDSLGAESDRARVEAPYVHLGPLEILSDREIEVLSLLATGLTAKQIAAKLDRSFKTVENHRYVIGRKLGATDRHALAAISIRAGLTARDATRTRL